MKDEMWSAYEEARIRLMPRLMEYEPSGPLMFEAGWNAAIEQCNELKQQRDEHKADAEIAIALCQKAEAELIALRAAIIEAEKVEPDYRAIADAVVGNLEARSQVINLDLEEELVEEIMQEMADTIRDGFTTPQPAIPAGYALVPVEPTPKMVDATWDEPLGANESHNARNKRIYKAMIAAAPKPEEMK